MSLYRGYFAPGGVDPSGTCDAEPPLGEKCKIKLFMGHANIMNHKDLNNWHRRNIRKANAAVKGTYYMGAVSCFSDRLYSTPMNRNFIPEKNQIPGFPLTGGVLNAGKGGDSEISEAYDVALKALDVSVQLAYELCENRNRYKDGPNNEDYMDKPHDCGHVEIFVDEDRDFERLIKLGIGPRNTQVIPKRSLPRRPLVNYKLNLNCDDVKGGGGIVPANELPSTIYALR